MVTFPQGWDRCRRRRRRGFGRFKRVARIKKLGRRADEHRKSLMENVGQNEAPPLKGCREPLSKQLARGVNSATVNGHYLFYLSRGKIVDGR